MLRLNPYCSGRWSRTSSAIAGTHCQRYVLILIVVEDGLVQRLVSLLRLLPTSLNPYCSGRWSRTYFAGDGEGVTVKS
ncbi:hypothetical protein [Segatella sinensis]|uniref:hypothetical protein n=1 Tax=Segatella sinensis TaxID=3085167 RepID=UPI003D730F0B